MSANKEYNRTWRKKNREKIREYMTQWREDHREDTRQKHAAWRKKNPEKVIAAKKRWAAKHPAVVKSIHRRFRQREKERNAAVVASLPCLDCGMQHTPERRQTIIRRMLPCSGVEIHEAWACIWGPSGLAHKSSAGMRMLLRDLHAMGAVRIGDTWYPATQARGAA